MIVILSTNGNEERLGTFHLDSFVCRHDSSFVAEKAMGFVFASASRNQGLMLLVGPNEIPVFIINWHSIHIISYILSPLDLILEDLAIVQSW